MAVETFGYEPLERGSHGNLVAHGDLRLDDGMEVGMKLRIGQALTGVSVVFEDEIGSLHLIQIEPLLGIYGAVGVISFHGGTDSRPLIPLIPMRLPGRPLGYNSLPCR